LPVLFRFSEPLHAPINRCKGSPKRQPTMLIQRIKHAILAFIRSAKRPSRGCKLQLRVLWMPPGRAKSCIPREDTPFTGRTGRVQGALPLLTALARCYPEPAIEFPCCALHSVYHTPHRPAGRSVRQKRSVAANDAMRQAGVSFGLVSSCHKPATRLAPFA